MNYRQSITIYIENKVVVYMVAIILVILGILFSIVGLIGLLAIAVSPLIDDWDVVVRRKDDSLFYSTSFGKRILKLRTKKMAWEYFSVLAIGVALFIAGMYFGFADRGKDFWFYKKIYGEETDVTSWDKLTDEGFYKDDEGFEFKCFILIRGDEVYYNGADEGNIVGSIDELRQEVGQTAPENTIAVIDSYALSSKYNEVIDMLDKLPRKYKEEVE